MPCTANCEPFAHDGCEIAAATADTERRARGVAMHGSPRIDDSMLGLYAETLRRGRLAGYGLSTVVAVSGMLADVPANELRAMLLAALIRLADAENERRSR